MTVAVGIDVAKDIHWIEVKVAETGTVLTSHAVENTPAAIAGMIDEVHAAETVHGPARVGIDLLGGIAGLLEAMLIEAELTVVHVPGLAVNRARRGTVGGEHKRADRKSVVKGKSVHESVDLGGRRIIIKKKNRRERNVKEGGK